MILIFNIFIGPVLRTLLDILILFTVFPLLVIVLSICIAYGAIEHFLTDTIPFEIRWWCLEISWWWRDIKEWFSNKAAKHEKT